MRRGSDHDRARTRLRLGIGLFVLALAAPSLLLVHKAYDQIQWEAFRQQQLAAEELADRIDKALAALVAAEDARPSSDYDFLIGSGDPANPYRRRSPLSDWPVSAAIPGLIGWFQVAADGRFSSPLVPESGLTPADHGVTPADLALRQAQARRIQGILVGNRLVERGAREPERDAPAASPTLAESGGGLGRTAVDAVSAAPKAEVPASATAELKARKSSASSDREESPSRLSQAAFERLASDRATPKAGMDKSKGLGRVDDLKLDVELAERVQGRKKDETVQATANESSALNASPPALAPAAVPALDPQGRTLADSSAVRAATRLGAPVRDRRRALRGRTAG